MSAAVIILIIAAAMARYLSKVRPTAPPVAVSGRVHGGAQRTHLVWEAGPAVGQTIFLNGRPLRIGRARECEIRVDALLVSRQHAVVEPVGRAWQVRDLESTNGTYINNRPVGIHALNSGDLIQVGPAQLRFNDGGPRSIGGSPQASAGRMSSSSMKRDVAPPSRPSRPAGGGQGNTELIPGYRLGQTWEGGHATVYHATRLSDGRECGVKILKVEDAYLTEKFSQEARALSSFRHAHVVQAFDQGIVNGRRYFVMEWCGGGNLRRRLMERGRPAAAEIVSIIGQACEGLHYAHRAGMIHRDLKPEHIMFDAHGRVKLVDFGVAKSQMSLTQTTYGTVVGTPAYLSPEQAKGDRVDIRTDIYAMGVVLYELLTSSPPFTGSYTDILDHHIRATARPPQEVVPGCDARLARAAMRALAKDPRQRFASAMELAEALGYRSGASSGSRPSP